MRLAILLCWMSFSAMISAQNQSPFVLILGITQDGGYPHIGCHGPCCSKALNNDSLKQLVVSLALADPVQKKWWLFEATPDITSQLELFQKLTSKQFNYLPGGIFLTHAHVGHYTGLMYLGREALNAQNVVVHAMPKMSKFLQNNGPWSQLVSLHNIQLKPLVQDQEERLSDNISITTFIVPHRDEFSETVGYRINTGVKRYLFIPDIDKWEKWGKNIVSEVSQVDVAFLDATFYRETELPGRNIKEVPHPFVTETMALFSNPLIKKKIQFIHFNHSNPLLWDENEKLKFSTTGFGLAQAGTQY